MPGASVAKSNLNFTSAAPSAFTLPLKIEISCDENVFVGSSNTNPLQLPKVVVAEATVASIVTLELDAGAPYSQFTCSFPFSVTPLCKIAEGKFRLIFIRLGFTVSTRSVRAKVDPPTSIFTVQFPVGAEPGVFRLKL